MRAKYKITKEEKAFAANFITYNNITRLKKEDKDKFISLYRSTFSKSKRSDGGIIWLFYGQIKTVLIPPPTTQELQSDLLLPIKKREISDVLKELAGRINMLEIENMVITEQNKELRERMEDYAVLQDTLDKINEVSRCRKTSQM